MGEGDGPLVLGPMLRYVDESSAAIWVETAAAATVTVRAGDRSWSARTFRVHDHHYGLVSCEGLEPGTLTPYSVLVDDAHEPASFARRIVEHLVDLPYLEGLFVSLVPDAYCVLAHRDAHSLVKKTLDLDPALPDPVGFVPV